MTDEYERGFADGHKCCQQLLERERAENSPLRDAAKRVVAILDNMDLCYEFTPVRLEMQFETAIDALRDALKTPAR